MPTSTTTESRSAHALMKAIGARSFDPMPPSQHEYLMDIDQTLDTQGMGWVFSKTIHPGKGGHRWSYARDWRAGKAGLRESHLAADMGWSPQQATAVLKKLEAQGRVTRDPDGKICLAGNVPPPRRTEDEGSDESSSSTFCTKPLPRSISLYLQRFSEIERSQYERRYREAVEYMDRLVVDAVAAARVKGYEAIDSLLREIGFEQPLGGRPRVDPAKLMVDLQVKPPFVQNGSGVSHKTENGFCPEPASLLPSESLLRADESEVNRESVENPGSREQGCDAEPPGIAASGSTEDPPVECEGESLVVAAVEHTWGFPLRQNDTLRRLFPQLVRKLKTDEQTLVQFLIEKKQGKGALRYTVHSAGALYQFTLEDFPQWMRKNAPEIRNRRIAEDRERREQREQQFQAETFNAELEGLRNQLERKKPRGW